MVEVGSIHNPIIFEEEFYSSKLIRGLPQIYYLHP